MSTRMFWIPALLTAGLAALGLAMDSLALLRSWLAVSLGLGDDPPGRPGSVDDTWPDRWAMGNSQPACMDSAGRDAAVICSVHASPVVGPG